MKTMNKNEKGSVLVWAAAIILIVAIFGVSFLGTAYSQMRRNADKMLLSQLELTAKSAAELIAVYAVSNEGMLFRSEIISVFPEKLTADGIFTESMGHCTAEAFLNANGEIIILATAQKGGLSAGVSAIISQSAGVWKIKSFGEAEGME
ncbi:MAG: hypothetical protein WC900_01625 [Oscillospiraceae bacterium]|jgi:phage tail sheath protein FI